MKPNILFLGDSFTWGEGLELYTDTPKWKAERNVENNWPTLSHKQDYEGTLFRESHRFSSIVGDILNCNSIVHMHNGGTLKSYIGFAETNLYKSHNIIDTVIVQLSCLNREIYHIVPECSCDICTNTEHRPFFPLMFSTLNKIYDYEKLNSIDLFLINFFEEQLSIKISDSCFFEKFTKFKEDWYKKTFKVFYDEHVTKWKRDKNVLVYFIDSWDDLSSEIIHQLINEDEIIPLIGKDDKLYLKWTDWETTFSSNRISSDFPNTKNLHPSLEQHKYIANSIINVLKHNKRFLNKQLI